jgi:thiol-disulfide isomerase/thioredoxin
MKKIPIVLIILSTLLIFALGAFFIFYTLFGSSANELAMKKAINFEANLINGEPFELDDLRGQYVLLDFWGSWCGPCRRANKGVVELHDEFKDKAFVDADGFKIVSVAIEKDSLRWKAAIAADQLHWEHHIMSSRSDENRISRRYDIKSIPAPILIGPDGQIIGFKWSERKMKKYLNKKIQ